MVKCSLSWKNKMLVVTILTSIKKHNFSPVILQNFPVLHMSFPVLQIPTGKICQFWKTQSNGGVHPYLQLSCIHIYVGVARIHSPPRGGYLTHPTRGRRSYGNERKPQASGIQTHDDFGTIFNRPARKVRSTIVTAPLFKGEKQNMFAKFKNASDGVAVPFYDLTWWAGR